MGMLMVMLLHLLGVGPMALHVAHVDQRHLAAQQGEDRLNAGLAFGEAAILDIEANLPVGVVAILGCLLVLHGGARERTESGLTGPEGQPIARQRFDIVGLVLSMVGFTALVYGISEAALRAPDALARSRSSVATRVLPRPASPRKAATVPRPLTVAAHARSSSPSSCSRPTSGNSPGSRGGIPRFGAGRASLWSCSASSRVAADGETPSSRRRRSPSAR